MGIMKYDTFEFLDFKRVSYIKLKVVLRCNRNRVFVVSFANLHFVDKVMIHEEQ